MLVIGIHQPQYFPWLGLIDRIYRCGLFVILDTVAYSKNYFYNRNRIKASGGQLWLSVPVLTKGHYGQSFTEARINNIGNWPVKHSKSIYHSYFNAPFFKNYEPLLASMLNRRWDFLVDLCLESLGFLMDSFGVKTKILRASQLGIKGNKEELLISICKELKATHYLSGVDGSNYIHPDIWKADNIEVDFQSYIHPVYQQLHGNFIPNMSSLDLLFNRGANGLKELTAGQPEYFERLRKIEGITKDEGKAILC